MAKGILSNIKDMADKFSDFASCESFSEDEEGSNSKSKGKDIFQVQGRKRKGKKHKHSPSPSKEYFLKKQILSNSPESKGLEVVDVTGQSSA